MFYLSLLKLVQASDEVFLIWSACKNYKNQNVGDYSYFNYTDLTTVVCYDEFEPSVVQKLRERVPQVHYMLRSFNQNGTSSNLEESNSKISNENFRKSRVADWLRFVKEFNFTGINLDVEQGFWPSDQKHVVSFTREFYEKFRENLERDFRITGAFVLQLFLYSQTINNLK